MTLTSLALAPAVDDVLERPPGAGLVALEPPVRHALALVLSHLLGRHGASLARPLTLVLRRYAHTDAMLDDGTELPAPAPWVAPVGVGPDVDHALERHGLTVAGFRDHWDAHRLASNGTAPLPFDLLEELVPADLWPVLALLIAEGPQVAAARLDQALLRESMQPLRRLDRRHAQRGHSQQPRRTGERDLRSMARAIRALMSALVDLGARSPLLSAALSHWDRAATITTPAGDDAQTDTTAVPRTAMRLLWQRTDAEIAERLPRAAAVGEIAALEQLTWTGLYRSGLFGPLRLRALLVLLAVVGARVGAISRLCVGDLELDRELPDGTRGPAIALRPGKTVRADVVRYKPIPPAAAAVILTYLHFLELRARRPRFPGEPMFVGKPASLRPWKPRMISRYVGGSSGKQQLRALIARGADPTHGYSPHTYRSYVVQQVRSLEVHEFLVAERLRFDQHWLAEALVDHGLPGMAPLYGGASKQRDRERLSAVAADLTWRILTTEMGARMVRDGDAFARALRAKLALSAELERLGGDVDEAFSVPSGRAQPSVGQLVDRVDQMMRAHALVRRERQVRDEIDRLIAELEEIRHSDRRLVAVVDDAPDEVLDVDLGAVERRVHAETAGDVEPGAPPARPAPARDWISVLEMRELSGSSPAAIRRWLGSSGGRPRLPFPDGDPRNPWPVDRVPIDDSLGERRRRIIAAGITESFLRAVPGRRERLDHLLARPLPAGWADEIAGVPLVLPPWL